MGDRYEVPADARHASYQQLVARDDVDAVFVLNSDEYHADCAIAAIRQRKHVLIEKPMCLTLREAEDIIRARDDAGVQVMIGYMHRFALAFVDAVERIKQFDSINYVRVRDIIGRNRLIVDQANTVLRPDDIPDVLVRDRAERSEHLVREAIGSATPELVRAYRLLCGLSSHDLSAMRELIGFPKRVVAASHWHGGNFLNVILDFGDFGAMFETGVDEQCRFDAHIEVYGMTSSVRVQYDTPYIRHLPTTMVRTETTGDAYVETVTRPTFKDPYTHEIEHFYNAVTSGADAKTTPEDFKEDLRLFELIMDALRRDASVSR
jgi:predicted dehydrogenase